MMSKLDIAKRRTLETARDLEYPAIVKERIRSAQAEVQITNILAEARRAS